MNIQTTTLPVTKGSLPLPAVQKTAVEKAAIEKTETKGPFDGRPVRLSRNLDRHAAFTYSQHAEPFRERVPGQIDEFV